MSPFQLNQTKNYKMTSKHLLNSSVLPTSSSSSILPLINQSNNNSNQISTVNQLFIENRSLKETLNVGLEFKRILEHMFSDQVLLQSSDPVLSMISDYETHFKEFLKKYNDLSSEFQQQQRQSLTKCYNNACKLIGCSNNYYINDYLFNENDYDFNGQNNDNQFFRSSFNKNELNIVNSMNVDDDDYCEHNSNDKKIIDNNNGQSQFVDSIMKTDETNEYKNENHHQQQQFLALIPQTSQQQQKQQLSSKRIIIKGLNFSGSSLLVSKSTSSSSSTATITNATSNKTSLTQPKKARAIVSNGNIITGQKNNKQVIRIKHEQNNDSEIRPIMVNDISLVSTSITNKDNNNNTSSKLKGLDASKYIMAETTMTNTDNCDDQQQQQQTVTKKQKNLQISCRVRDCGQMFTEPSLANVHYKSHCKLFKCSMCDALYSKKALIFRHYQIAHSYPESNTTSTIGTTNTTETTSTTSSRPV